MKRIPLTGKNSQGQYALIDDEDYEIISLFKWWLGKTKRNKMIIRTTIHFGNQKKCIIMSRLIMNAPRGMLVDHINHDTLFNIKANLRVCTTRENSQNMLPLKGKSSKFKGVAWSKQCEKWKSYIRNNGKLAHLGYFHEEEAAAQAYDIKARELFGEFAYYNNIGI